MTGNLSVPRWLCGAAAAVLIVAGGDARADDSLSLARELYASAAYEDALLLLNRLRSATQKPDDYRTIEQYRAFCLLALGRSSDAERAIEAVIAAAPSYLPSETEVSPRVRAAFVDVRRRMLPAIIHEKYAAAKSVFDSDRFKEAAVAFEQVLAMLQDPALGSAVAEPPLSDLKTLATGFHELSVKAAEPPPPPPTPVAAPPPAPPPPAPATIYVQGDPRVVPPIAIRQFLPPFPTQVVIPGTGLIEIVIDAKGAVESAVMRTPLHPRYDSLAIAAAKTWSYQPARMNGVPVRFKKFVQVTLKR
jgi:hypothetical protein